MKMVYITMNNGLYNHESSELYMSELIELEVLHLFLLLKMVKVIGVT